MHTIITRPKFIEVLISGHMKDMKKLFCCPQHLSFFGDLVCTSLGKHQQLVADLQFVAFDLLYLNVVPDVRVALLTCVYQRCRVALFGFGLSTMGGKFKKDRFCTHDVPMQATSSNARTEWGLTFSSYSSWPLQWVTPSGLLSRWS